MTGSPIGSSQRTFVLYMHFAQADPLEVLLTEGVKSPYSTLAAWPDGHPLLPPLRTVASTDSPQLVKTLMLLGLGFAGRGAKNRQAIDLDRSGW
jgi:hypothetical protein